MSTKPKRLPPWGKPTGGFKNYRDCQGGMSTMCCRPDCKRCGVGLAEQRKAEIRRLRAIVEPLEGLLDRTGASLLVMRGMNDAYRVIAANAEASTGEETGDTLAAALAAAAEGLGK